MLVQAATCLIGQALKLENIDGSKQPSSVCRESICVLTGGVSC